MFPSTSARETSSILRKQNSLFPSGPDIKCILYAPFQNPPFPFALLNKYLNFGREFSRRVLFLFHMLLNNGTFSLLYNKLPCRLISFSIMLSVSCYKLLVLIVICIRLTQPIVNCSQRTISTKHFHRKAGHSRTLQAVVHEMR